jgi:hypothetical protein
MRYWLRADTGDIWIGAEAPRDLTHEIPVEVLRPSHRAWAEYLRDADPHGRLTTDFVEILRRTATAPTPYTPDEVREWLADRLWRQRLRLWRRYSKSVTPEQDAGSPPPLPMPDRRIVVPGPRGPVPSIAEIVKTVVPEVAAAVVPAFLEEIGREIVETVETFGARLADGLFTWYEFRLVDEAEGGIAGVTIILDTPGGRFERVTDGDGVARVDLVPPAKAMATIALDSLADALASRVERPRRLPRLPEERDDFHIATPRRAGTRWALDMERPHAVMIVSRMDLRVGGTLRPWRALALDDPLADPCRLQPDAPIALALCSWGQGRSGVVRGSGADPHNASTDRPLPAVATSGSYVVKGGDSFWAIADHFYGEGWRYTEIEAANADLLAGRPPHMIHPGDVLRIPGLAPAPSPSAPAPWPASPEDAPIDWIDLDVDGLHEALFDGDAGDWFDRLAMPLQRPPDPPPPDWDPPVDAAAAYAAHSVALTLENGPDPGEAAITEPVDTVAPPPAPPQLGRR